MRDIVVDYRKIKKIEFGPWKYSTYSQLLIITGVQASGVIIDRLLQQCCFVWSEIVGPHSSGNFNDWPIKLKAGSKIWVVVIGMRYQIVAR